MNIDSPAAVEMIWCPTFPEKILQNSIVRHLSRLMMASNNSYVEVTQDVCKENVVRFLTNRKFQIQRLTNNNVIISWDQCCQ